MFVIYEKGMQRVPIKVWLKGKDDLEQGAYEQAVNLSNLPFLHKWVCLMPDVHSGYGMPIGGVIATKNVVIPNAVGLDQGCGMCFSYTSIPVEILKNTQTGSGTLIQDIVGSIMRAIPVGFQHHKEPQRSAVLDDALKENFYYDNLELRNEIEKGYYQIGTLGGGNHFIELQEDEQGYLGIMIHSGSRNFGYKIARYFNNIAKELNEKWYSEVPLENDLAFLPIDTDEGQSYIGWMDLALDFAAENRQVMMDRVRNIVFDAVKKYTDLRHIEVDIEVNAHHNYAAIEHHYGKNVWVHRKGAIRVRKDELGIIPGAMGSYSYIVKGKGNPESFCSCSHGAGRKMSRKKAREEITTQQMMEDLKFQEVVLGVKDKSNITDESRFAYKNIDEVIGNEADLIEPIMKLKTVAVVKGD